MKKEVAKWEKAAIELNKQRFRCHGDQVRLDDWAGREQYLESAVMLDDREVPMHERELDRAEDMALQLKESVDVVEILWGQKEKQLRRGQLDELKKRLEAAKHINGDYGRGLNALERDASDVRRRALGLAESVKQPS